MFSSLHTNSAAGVITRLIDMGVLPFQVAATLRLSIAQRLVRRLCPQVPQPNGRSPRRGADARPPAARRGTTVYDPGHCDACEQRGFRGRLGIFEMLPISDDLAQRIVGRCDEVEILKYMAEKKIPRLFDDALEKLIAGGTSYSEVIGVPR